MKHAAVMAESAMKKATWRPRVEGELGVLAPLLLHFHTHTVQSYTLTQVGGGGDQQGCQVSSTSTKGEGRLAGCQGEAGWDRCLLILLLIISSCQCPPKVKSYPPTHSILV